MSSNHPNEWTGEERRALTVDRVTAMVELAVDEAMAKHQADMIQHIDSKFGQLHTFIASAFPGGDPVGHRIAHEGQIKTAEFWSKIKASLAEKLAFGIVSGGLVFLAMAAWEAFKVKVGAK